MGMSHVTKCHKMSRVTPLTITTGGHLEFSPLARGRSIAELMHFLHVKAARAQHGRRVLTKDCTQQR